jgi:predicted NodU family carbamoyl transferase
VLYNKARAASIFILPLFNKAAIFTVDGVGEWKTVGLYFENGSEIIP